MMSPMGADGRGSTPPDPVWRSGGRDITASITASGSAQAVGQPPPPLPSDGARVAPTPAETRGDGAQRLSQSRPAAILPEPARLRFQGGRNHCTSQLTPHTDMSKRSRRSPHGILGLKVAQKGTVFRIEFRD